MVMQIKEVLKPQNVSNEDLPSNEIKSDLKGIIRGEFDDSIEPSYLEWDLRYYADPPESEFGL